MMLKTVRSYKEEETLMDITKISVLAKEAKKTNPDVIDATIGSLYDDEGKFYAFKTVNEIIQRLDDEEKYPYAPVSGGAAFQNQVLNWIFGPHLASVVAHRHVGVCATCGGSGALSIAMYHYLKEGETLMLPDIDWPIYEKMAMEYGINVKRFTMFENGRFNLKGFRSVADEIIAKEKKLVVIVNNPNHNPSGYTMNLRELDDLGDYFKELKRRNVPVVLIYDIAYIDYYDYETGRKGLSRVTEYPDNVLVLVSMSASKTFGLYGMRLGALIAVNADEEVINDFKDCSTIACRTRWGSPNRIAVSIFNRIASDKDLQYVFLQELKAAQALLNNRARLFIEKAKEYHIPLYPFENGFFATVRTDESVQLYEYLKKENIYAVPFTLGLRLAISSLAIKDIDITLQKIKEYFDHGR